MPQRDFFSFFLPGIDFTFYLAYLCLSDMMNLTAFIMFYEIFGFF